MRGSMFFLALLLATVLPSSSLPLVRRTNDGPSSLQLALSPPEGDHAVASLRRTMVKSEETQDALRSMYASGVPPSEQARNLIQSAMAYGDTSDIGLARKIAESGDKHSTRNALELLGPMNEPWKPKSKQVSGGPSSS